jgi:tetratricopeptide (TPR) repeat protein
MKVNMISGPLALALAWLGVATVGNIAFAATPGGFAPVPADHELAALWNDADFQRRLVGSYGFASEVEPKLQPDELDKYRTVVVPILTNSDPKKIISTIEGLTGPRASAVFDFTLGNVYFQRENLTNAVKHFETAILKFPDYRRAQKNLAFALVRDGKYAEAIKPLTRTIALGGGDGKVFGLLGFASLSQGRNVSAEAAYRQALVYEPENLDFKLGLVKSCIGTGNHDYAAALIDELLKQYPERDNLWTLQANLFIQKDQPAKAALSLEMLRRLGKAPPPSLNLLGDLYMAQESRELALGAYLEALEKDNGQNPARALRPAQIMVGRGAFAEAQQLFARIRAASTPLSGADELKLLKLESKVAMSTGSGERAIESLEQIIQKDPLDAEALLLAGDYYAKNDQKEKAEFRYQTAAGIGGFEAEAFVKHAQLLVQSQKYPQALELLKKAQKVKPRDNVQRYLEKVEQLARSGRS